jgi:predicted nucleic acid-binding protein
VILVDTSIWVDVFRDARKGAALERLVGADDVVISRFTELELLQGAKHEREWRTLRDYLDAQSYLEMREVGWAHAARIHFDLRRKGLTVRSALDCCIAQLALDNEALLLHRHADFEAIGKVRALEQSFVSW